MNRRNQTPARLRSTVPLFRPLPGAATIYRGVGEYIEGKSIEDIYGYRIEGIHDCYFQEEPKPELTVEIDGFVNGEEKDARKIPNMVEYSADADTDNDARVITGGYVLFKARVSGAVEPLKYEWSISKGNMETDNTRIDVKWDAPKEEGEVVLTLKIKSAAGVVLIT